MRHIILAASGAALLAFAAPANAMAVFSATSFARFEAAFDTGAVEVLISTSISDEMVEETGTGVVTDIAETQLEAPGFVSTEGLVAGEALAPTGLASAELFTDGFISFENTSADPTRLAYFWDLGGEVSVSVDDTSVEAASAFSTSRILAVLDPATGSAAPAVLDILGEGAAGPSFPFDSFADDGFGSVDLAPGDVLDVFLRADQLADAEVVGGGEAAIPLPAAAPLVLGGLAALGAARARRRRA